MAHDPIPLVVGALALVLGAAKLAGHLCVRLGQPSVLGELVLGVLLGNLHLVGLPSPLDARTEPALELLSGLGALLLLFEVGLASTIKDILKVGVPSLLVAVSGVVAPLILGAALSAALLPDRSIYVHAFIAASLTATSVGITARVLKDLGRSQSSEARIIVGAAVIDDVLGLVVLAIIGGTMATSGDGSGSYGSVFWVVAKAALFIFGSLVIGVYLSPQLLRLSSRLYGRDVRLITALVFCFAFSYVASLAGLAAIVGAYAAGLVLEDVHFGPTTAGAVQPLETMVQPLSAFLTPVFFVAMGAHVQMQAFAHVDVLVLAALITMVAIVGKVMSGLAVARRGLDTLSIGIGMVPRGEVGLIFANAGLSLTTNGQRVIDDRTFAALVAMIVVTTLLTPPALGWSLARHRSARPLS